MSAFTLATRNPSGDGQPERADERRAEGTTVVAGAPGWALPGTGKGRTAQLWTVGILAGLLASQLLLQPDGPWEQDEAIFSTGVISFDVPRHQPHPPGFPGWILLGKLLFPFTGDALLALRLWSCVCSVGMVWLLSRLLSRLTSSGAALAGSLAYALSPLVWAHSPRAFSTIPALFLGMLALYLWVYRPTLTSARALTGWAILGFAATVRPQLAPELTIIAVAGLWHLRSRLGLAVLGVATSVLVVVAVFGVAIADSGLEAYWTATRAHLGQHLGSRIAPRKGPTGLLQRIEEWGIVRTSGGVWGSSLLVVTSAAGLLSIYRRKRTLAVWWLVLILVTAGMLMFAHSPRAPRYQVALMLVLAGPIAVALGELGRAGSLALAAAALGGAIAAYPAVRAMHDTPLPVVAALRAVATMDARGILHSAGLFSFAKLLHFEGRFRVRPLIPSGNDIGLPRNTYAVGTGREIKFLPGAHTCTWTFDDFPQAAWDLSQRRFNRVTVAQNPVLLGRGVYRSETIKGSRAAWLSDQATLLVPTPSSLLLLNLDVPKHRAPQRLLASSEGRTLLSQTLGTGKHTIAVPLASCTEQCRVSLELPDAWSSGRDPRVLSAKLIEAWAIESGEPGGWKWRPDAEAPPGVELAGFYPPEDGSAAAQGRWTRDHAAVRFGAAKGTLIIGIRRPQYVDGVVRIATQGSELLPDVDAETNLYAVRVEGDSVGRVSVSLEGPTFTPAQVEPGSSDTRSLALQVSEMEFFPDRRATCGELPMLPTADALAHSAGH